jgi:hypothetical protein
VSKNERPKPRLAPPATAVAATNQSALDRLKALDEWTEEPTTGMRAALTGPAPVAPVAPVVAEPAAQAPAETVQVAQEVPPAAPQRPQEPLAAQVAPLAPEAAAEVATAVVDAKAAGMVPAPAAAERAKRPWEVPSANETHPYHVVLTERLFQKMDFVWKRGDYRSAREFVLVALEKAADQALRDLGEEP